MSYTANDLLRSIEADFIAIRNESDPRVRDLYMARLADLKDAVNKLNAKSKKLFGKLFHGFLKNKYQDLYDELMLIWADYERDSADARQRNGGTMSNTMDLRATESSPSLGVPPQQQFQGYRSQTASRSTAAVQNAPTNTSGWSARIFLRRAPTTDRNAYQSASSNASIPNVALSAEQQQAYVSASTWSGQQYHQPQRGTPTRDGSMHQFAPPNAPGPYMALPAEQHRAYAPQRIITQREIDQVERQVDEEWMRRTMPVQGPGHPEMAQHAQTNVFPQGQYSLPPPPRPAQRQSGFVQYEAQAQAGINAHAGPSHTRSQTVASGNTFGHELPGQPGFSAYDRRGDSLDSDSSTVSRTSYSSEGGYQSHRYRQN